MSRTFVMGDIHGAYRALRQCLQRAEFDYVKDHLICLGDVADGWPETRACIDELLKITNLTYLLGNHDWWTLEWMRDGIIEPIWYSQGGKATIDSYADGIPTGHVAFLSGARRYYVLKNKLFVHAGIDPVLPLDQQDEDTFLWDRTLAAMALQRHRDSDNGRLTSFDEVYIGHTPIPFSAPIKAASVWLMDTGAGWSGVLSMMDIDTKMTYISDAVPSLYPGVEGRKKRGQ